MLGFMRNVLIQSILLLLATMPAALAETYKWVDDEGVVHFSDQPYPDAEEIEISEVQLFSAPTPVSAPAGSSTPNTSEQPAETSQAGYQSFEITSPVTDDVFHNIGGELGIKLSLQPPRLLSGHQVAIFLDGVLAEDWDSAEFNSGTLKEVYRGEHTITAEVRDANDNTLVKTKNPVTFFVLQRTVN
ncbi:MAG: DUF4124 domain-containing protein [Gammaproteobacteria bacterium]|nr:DUF4124 domain-containing protein [Gammaproteobacteria bacterium]